MQLNKCLSEIFYSGLLMEARKKDPKRAGGYFAWSVAAPNQPEPLIAIDSGDYVYYFKKFPPDPNTGVCVLGGIPYGDAGFMIPRNSIVMAKRTPAQQGLGTFDIKKPLSGESTPVGPFDPSNQVVQNVLASKEDYRRQQIRIEAAIDLYLKNPKDTTFAKLFTSEINPLIAAPVIAKVIKKLRIELSNVSSKVPTGRYGKTLPPELSLSELDLTELKQLSSKFHTLIKSSHTEGTKHLDDFLDNNIRNIAQLYFYYRENINKMKDEERKTAFEAVNYLEKYFERKYGIKDLEISLLEKPQTSSIIKQVNESKSKYNNINLFYMREAVESLKPEAETIESLKPETEIQTDIDIKSEMLRVLEETYDSMTGFNGLALFFKFIFEENEEINKIIETYKTMKDANRAEYESAVINQDQSKQETLNKELEELEFKTMENMSQLVNKAQEQEETEETIGMPKAKKKKMALGDLVGYMTFMRDKKDEVQNVEFLPDIIEQRKKALTDIIGTAANEIIDDPNKVVYELWRIYCNLDQTMLSKKPVINQEAMKRYSAAHIVPSPSSPLMKLQQNLLQVRGTETSPGIKSIEELLNMEIDSAQSYIKTHYYDYKDILDKNILNELNVGTGGYMVIILNKELGAKKKKPKQKKLKPKEPKEPKEILVYGYWVQRIKSEKEGTSATQYGDAFSKTKSHSVLEVWDFGGSPQPLDVVLAAVKGDLSNASEGLQTAQRMVKHLGLRCLEPAYTKRLWYQQRRIDLDELDPEAYEKEIRKEYSPKTINDKLDSTGFTFLKTAPKYSTDWVEKHGEIIELTERKPQESEEEPTTKGSTGTFVSDVFVPSYKIERGKALTPGELKSSVLAPKLKSPELKSSEPESESPKSEVPVPVLKKNIYRGGLAKFNIAQIKTKKPEVEIKKEPEKFEEKPEIENANDLTKD